MNISNAAIIEWAEAQKRQKFTWLEDHGPRSKRPRPETEAENKLRDIAMLDAVIEICKGEGGGMDAGRAGMTSVAHSLRDLLAGHRTDVGCLVRAYVGLWLFDRWLRQIWRHMRRHVWRELRVIGLRDRRRRHSDLLFDAATDAGLCLFHEPRVMPHARRADVFAREQRAGWHAFGNEVTKFNEVAA